MSTPPPAALAVQSAHDEQSERFGQSERVKAAEFDTYGVYISAHVDADTGTTYFATDSTGTLDEVTTMREALETFAGYCNGFADESDGDEAHFWEMAADEAYAEAAVLYPTEDED